MEAAHTATVVQREGRVPEAVEAAAATVTQELTLEREIVETAKTAEAATAVIQEQGAGGQAVEAAATTVHEQRAVQTVKAVETATTVVQEERAGVQAVAATREQDVHAAEACYAHAR